jgi:hypothetical protein
MASADPMIVWGRVNLHRTKGKGGLEDSFSAAAGMTVVDVSRSTDDERRQDDM